ncbi:hypothetical protein ACHAWF_011055 [Thalassiosira exigua]
MKALFEVRGGADEDGSEGGAAVIDADVATAVADDGEAAAPADGVEPAAAEGGEESTADAAEGGEEDVAVEEEEPVPRNLTFSATKPHDGSAEDPDGLPARFLAMKKGDREEAKECFAAHLAWRAELAVDDLLSRPHHKFDLCKALVPHYIAGRDPHGNVVFVQRPALLDFELMRKNNSTIDDLLLHYVYVIEYCWNILEPGPPEGIMTNVLDMRGLSFRSMKNQEYIGFAKRFVNMMSMNYPGRSYKTLIVNAPKWFHALYKVFKPLLRESTRQKIVILKAGEQQDQALKFYLGDALPQDLITGDGKHEPGTRYFIPVEESEKCEPGPNSEVEFDMRQFVSALGAFFQESLSLFD